MQGFISHRLGDEGLDIPDLFDGLENLTIEECQIMISFLEKWLAYDEIQARYLAGIMQKTFKIKVYARRQPSGFWDVVTEPCHGLDSTGVLFNGQIE